MILVIMRFGADLVWFGLVWFGLGGIGETGRRHAGGNVYMSFFFFPLGLMQIKVLIKTYLPFECIKIQVVVISLSRV